jgi:hypothetical protein
VLVLVAQSVQECIGCAHQHPADLLARRADMAAARWRSMRPGNVTPRRSFIRTSTCCFSLILQYWLKLAA